MNNTLIKLGAIANFADVSGEYEMANQSTQLIKESQIFDALRSLFDPGYAGMDRSDSYWRRLQRGWRRGKMDRGLGLLLAINAERTKLNRKIEQIAAPIKGFGEQVNAFYAKLLSSSNDINASNLRDELRGLQEGLKATLKLVAGKELKNALKLRERLSEQQLRALDKVKGLDEDTKAGLSAVLRGEMGSPQNTGNQGMSGRPGEEERKGQLGQRSNTTERVKMLAWLKKLPIPKKGIHYGVKSYYGLKVFTNYQDLYKYNPAVITEFFLDHPDLDDEGTELFGAEFGELRWQAHRAMRADESKADEQPLPERKQKLEAVPGTPPIVMAPPAIDQIREEVAERPITTPGAQSPALAPSDQPSHSYRVNAPLSPEEMAKVEVPVAAPKAKPKKEKEEKGTSLRDLAAPYKKDEEDTLKGLLALENKTLEPQPLEPATGSAKRLAREITRFGRLQAARKLGELIKGAITEDEKEEQMDAKDEEADWREGIESGRPKDADDEMPKFTAKDYLNMYRGDPPILDLPEENIGAAIEAAETEDQAEQAGVANPDLDIYERFPEGRERFNEEKHPDVDEVEYYKGRDDDNGDHYEETKDIRNLGLGDYDEDGDYLTERDEPSLKPATKKEELEYIMRLLRQNERATENLIRHSNPDNRYADEMTLRRYKSEKTLLLKRKQELSGLPEGW